MCTLSVLRGDIFCQSNPSCLVNLWEFRLLPWCCWVRCFPFGDVLQCRLVVCDRRFRAVCWSYLQGLKHVLGHRDPWVCCSEMAFTSYQWMLYNIPEELRPCCALLYGIKFPLSWHCAYTYVLCSVWVTDCCTICCRLLLEVLPTTKYIMLHCRQAMEPNLLNRLLLWICLIMQYKLQIFGMTGGEGHLEILSTVCVIWELVLQSQKAAPHQTQSHVVESWHGGLALSRRISWRSCHRCGPLVVGTHNELGHPTLPKRAPVTRLQALIQLMGPWRRILCETWIFMWSRCVILELL
jgi:hypothetical protein